MLPKIPEKCLICGAPYKGGCERPGYCFPKSGLRVFYRCGASMSIIVKEIDYNDNCYFIRFKNCHSENGIYEDDKQQVKSEKTD